MVLKGQFLERPTLIPTVGDAVLEGVSHRGERAPLVLVLPPPPIEGSGMDHVVGAEVAFAVTRQGHGSLRFNYRGVAGSQGHVGKEPRAWLEDAEAAFVVARENALGGPVIGVSIGASDAVLLELAKRVHLKAAAFVSPTFLRPLDLAAAPPGLLVTVVLPELETQHDRLGFHEVLEQREGQLVVIGGATRAYQRNLTQVGKAVAALAERVGSLLPTS